MTDLLQGKQRWTALYILCTGVLMIVLDTTIVNVALPAIKADLGFGDASLAWVVNAYMLTFGGFLLLGGRLGDLFGYRRMFLIGLTVFTLASLACGVAWNQTSLVAARAVQGLGGAVLSAVALALMMGLFTEPRERAKAMGVYSFVAAGGGSLGVLLGGILTDAFDWHWNFLINIPIGIAVFVASWRLLPKQPRPENPPRLDIWGAVTVTSALMLAVYATLNGNAWGWMSVRTLGLLGVAVALFLTFLVVETRVREPLLPLRLFKVQSVAAANGAGVLWAAAMFAWFFMSALYMGAVLGLRDLHIGLAFLPANLIMAAFALGLSARLVIRFGIRLPLSLGLALAALGLFWFARAPVDGTFLVDVLPGMVLLGVGAGMALNPIILGAMRDVDESQSGLASGMVNTSFMMGGALGLAVLASVAAARSADLGAAGSSLEAALAGGYRLAFLVGGLFAAAAAAITGVLLGPAPADGGTTAETDPHADAVVAVAAATVAAPARPEDT